MVRQNLTNDLRPRRTHGNPQPPATTTRRSPGGSLRFLAAATAFLVFGVTLGTSSPAAAAEDFVTGAGTFHSGNYINYGGWVTEAASGCKYRVYGILHYYQSTGHVNLTTHAEMGTVSGLGANCMSTSGRLPSHIRIRVYCTTLGYETAMDTGWTYGAAYSSTSVIAVLGVTLTPYHRCVIQTQLFGQGVWGSNNSTYWNRPTGFSNSYNW